MSGGLGSSVYVQNKLREHYLPQSQTRPVISGLKFHVSTDPQLSVCRGLVRDSLQRMVVNSPIIPRRCARASFGIPHRKPYGKPFYSRWNKAQVEAKRTGRVRLDEFSQPCIEDCVNWFIEKVNHLPDADCDRVNNVP